MGAQTLRRKHEAAKVTSGAERVASSVGPLLNAGYREAQSRALDAYDRTLPKFADAYEKAAPRVADAYERAAPRVRDAYARGVEGVRGQVETYGPQVEAKLREAGASTREHARELLPEDGAGRIGQATAAAATAVGSAAASAVDVGREELGLGGRNGADLDEVKKSGKKISKKAKRKAAKAAAKAAKSKPGRKTAKLTAKAGTSKPARKAAQQSAKVAAKGAKSKAGRKAVKGLGKAKMSKQSSRGGGSLLLILALVAVAGVAGYFAWKKAQPTEDPWAPPADFARAHYPTAGDNDSESGDIAESVAGAEAGDVAQALSSDRDDSEK